MKKREKPKNPGEHLKRKRVREALPKQVVAKKLGITAETFEDLENWRLSRLPDNSHLAPLVRKYANLVGVDVKDLKIKYPHAMKRHKKKSNLKVFNTDKSSVVLSSVAKAMLAIIVILIVGSYAAWQSSSLGSRPRLEISSPVSDSVVTTEVLPITGVTSQEAQVFVNGSPVLVNERGEFDSTIVLQEGVNTVTVTSINNVGTERRETLSVILTDEQF